MPIAESLLLIMVCKAERNQLNTGTLCMWRWQLEQAVFYTEVQKV